MLPPNKLRELETRHTEILLEFNQLKKGLEDLDDINLDSIIDNMKINGNLKNDNFNYQEKKEDNEMITHNNIIDTNKLGHQNIDLKDAINTIENFKYPNSDNLNNSDSDTLHNFNQDNLHKSNKNTATDNLNSNNKNNNNILVKGHFKERSIRNKKKENEPYVYIKPYKRKKTKKKDGKERLKNLIHKIHKKK